MDNPPDPHQFTGDAWEANAEIWDERMGDAGNDFFKKGLASTLAKSQPLSEPIVCGY